MAHPVLVVGIDIDIDKQNTGTSALVVALSSLVAAGPELPRARRAAERADNELPGLLSAARPAGSRVRKLFSSRERRDTAAEAVGRIEALLAEAVDQSWPVLFAQASADLLRQPVAFQASPLRAQLGAVFVEVLDELLVRLVDEFQVADQTLALGLRPPGVSQEVGSPVACCEELRLSSGNNREYGACS